MVTKPMATSSKPAKLATLAVLRSFLSWETRYGYRMQLSADDDRSKQAVLGIACPEDSAATLMNYAAAPYRRHNDKSLVLVSNYIFTLLCNSPFGHCHVLKL